MSQGLNPSIASILKALAFERGLNIISLPLSSRLQKQNHFNNDRLRQLEHLFLSSSLPAIIIIFFSFIPKMSLRTRSSSAKETTTTTASTSDVQIQKTPKAPSPSLLSQTLTSTANLANLLPTGTLLAFQLLIPSFTNNGSCNSATLLMTQLLLVVLASSCFLASFTDSFRSPDGQVYHGIATLNGMWLFDYSGSETNLPDLSKYRLRFIDGFHAVLSVFVFVAVAMRDPNILRCFYPQPEPETQQILNIAPVGMGVICSLLFVAFPTRRHGIGYPVSSRK